MDQMERNIKNIVDDVEVPTNKLDETVNRSLQIAKKQSKQTFNRKQNIFASLASVFVLVIGALLFTSYYEKNNNENSTTASSPESSIIYHKGDEGLKRMVKEGRVNKNFLVAEDQGIRVFLEESYLDNYQMAISYRVDGLDLLGKETTINWELYVNGESVGGASMGGLVNRDLFYKGHILPTLHTNEFPDEGKVKLHITSIDDIKGNWIFQFPIKKEEEYIALSSLPKKEDKNENSFNIRKVELTPTTLLVNAITKLAEERRIAIDHYMHDFFVTAAGSDGEMHIERVNRGWSNSGSSIIQPGKTYKETVEITRSNNLYKYKLTPFLVKYKGYKVDNNSGTGESYRNYELTAPFATGSIIQLDSNIEVLNIEEKNDVTIVYYKMNEDLPIFPRIRDLNSDEEFMANSYKVENDYIKVTYPKVDLSSNLELMLYDATYKVYSDLAIEFELK